MVENGGEALLGQDDEHDLAHLAADLQADAARTHAVEGRVAPAVRRGAGQQDAAPAGGPQDEAALHQLGHNDGTAGLAHVPERVGIILAAQNLTGGIQRLVDQ